ncbi:hypothetical protein BBJ28_00020108 [Nothophytophthora sp. Chile5]|nr:hypothetical protein BBJ28_00020108 [Nothophytophthora sp. Chile5]
MEPREEPVRPPARLAQLQTMGSSLPALLESFQAASSSFRSDVFISEEIAESSDSDNDSDSNSDSSSESDQEVVEIHEGGDGVGTDQPPLDREQRRQERRRNAERKAEEFLLLPTPTRSPSFQRRRPTRTFQEASDPCLLAADDDDEINSLDEVGEEEEHEQGKEGEVKQQEVTQQERQRRWESRGSKTELETAPIAVEVVVDLNRPTTSLSVDSEPSSSSSSDLLVTTDRETLQLMRRAIPKPPHHLVVRDFASDETPAESLRHRYDRRFVPCAWILANVGQRTLRKLGDIRNSYFATWLVACSLFVVLLNVFAILIVHLAYHKDKSHSTDRPHTQEDIGKVCHHWLELLMTMHFVGLPNIVLIAPVVFPNEFFSLYRAKDKRMIRRPYLLLCELIVTVQLGFMMYVAVNQLLNVPVIVQCHGEVHSRELVMFYSAAVVWLVLLRQIVVFCRFLTHLKLQADSSNDASHTSALGHCLKTLLSLPTLTKRAKLAKQFKKLLYRAVARGDVLTVETLLAEAPGKYQIDRLQDLYKSPTLWLYAFARSSKNPLHIAVKRGNLVIVQLLLQHGMDVNALDKVARVNFNVGLVFKIVSRLLVRTQDGLRSPLKALLCSVLLPPLHGAVAEGYVHIVRLLISKGADVNALPRASFYYPAAVLPPVFVADDPQVLRLLVANGANFLQVASVSLTGMIRTFATPLQQSTFTLRSDLSDYLLECGGDVALTPLHEAAATDNTRKIKWLLARGIQVDTLGERVEGVHHRTPLHWAAVVGKAKAATVLLEHGADPNAKDRDGRTPLHWAARNNHHEVVALLLSRGAQADATDNEGTPVVCFAAEAEGVSMPIFSSLVAAGASLQMQVADGNTALHIALMRENRQTALSLIKCGANMMITNSFGKRAVDCTTSTELQFSLKKEAGSRKIMISYTHTHAQFAQKVREYLETHEQLTCWMDTMDPSGIGGGAVWREEIARGINNCSLVLSIVCDGYTKSEWCLKELALAKLLRKPVLGLIVEEDHTASMAALESLIPFKNRIPFNDFIVKKRTENPRAVVFEIDDAVFAERWQVTRPLMISIMKDGRLLGKEERDDMASIIAPRRKRRQKEIMSAVVEESKENGSTEANTSPEVEHAAASQGPRGGNCLRIYSPLGAASSLREKLKTDLESFGFPCQDLEEDHLVSQLNGCHGVVLLVELPEAVGEKRSKENKLARKQVTATMTRIVIAAQTVSPRKSVYPVLVHPNFLDLSKMYTLARSELFYFVDGGGWNRSVGNLVNHLRQKQERASGGIGVAALKSPMQ